MASSFADPDDFGDMLSLSTSRNCSASTSAPPDATPARASSPPTVTRGRRYYVLKDELMDFIRAQPSEPADDAAPVPVRPRDLGPDDET